jgi:carbon-monoxide dehydrogenase medium subunit
VSGLAAGPVRLVAAERLLLSEKPSHEAFRAAAVEAEGLDATDDAFVKASYRKHLVRVLTYRALERAVGGVLRRAA